MLVTVNRGRTEPHFSVLSTDKYKSNNLADHSEEFYQSATLDVAKLRNSAARHGIDLSRFADCLELGCGVGRVTRKLAGLFKNVIAVDISTPHTLSMWRQKLEDEEGVTNVAHKAHGGPFALWMLSPPVRCVFLGHRPST